MGIFGSIMVKMEFAQQWISVIMGMVRTVPFSVLFNGNKLEEFKPSRGIRQGDPISPYIFLLVGEGLSCLLKSNFQSPHLEGIRVTPVAPPVNHLLFADDSRCFLREVVREQKSCLTFWRFTVRILDRKSIRRNPQGSLL
jgi:hypothetical protein